ncbi:hypothetical protein ACU8V7_04665 [Zobellia nedashkovskayae]
MESERVMLRENEEEPKRLINKIIPEVKFVLTDADIIYLSKQNISKAETLLSNETNIHNNTMLLLNGIYESKKKRNHMGCLKKAPQSNGNSRYVLLRSCFL